jgi:hypothetical protein
MQRIAMMRNIMSSPYNIAQKIFKRHLVSSPICSFKNRMVLAIIRFLNITNRKYIAVRALKT